MQGGPGNEGAGSLLRGAEGSAAPCAPSPVPSANAHISPPRRAGASGSPDSLGPADTDTPAAAPPQGVAPAGSHAQMHDLPGGAAGQGTAAGVLNGDIAGGRTEATPAAPSSGGRNIVEEEPRSGSGQAQQGEAAEMLEHAPAHDALEDGDEGLADDAIAAAIAAEELAEEGAAAAGDGEAVVVVVADEAAAGANRAGEVRSGGGPVAKAAAGTLDAFLPQDDAAGKRLAHSGACCLGVHACSLHEGSCGWGLPRAGLTFCRGKVCGRMRGWRHSSSLLFFHMT